MLRKLNHFHRLCWCLCVPAKNIYFRLQLYFHVIARTFFPMWKTSILKKRLTDFITSEHYYNDLFLMICIFFLIKKLHDNLYLWTFYLAFAFYDSIAQYPAQVLIRFLKNLITTCAGYCAIFFNHVFDLFNISNYIRRCVSTKCLMCDRTETYIYL